MRAGLLVVLLVLADLGSAIAVIKAKHESRSLQNELQELRMVRDRLNTEWSQLQLEESAWAGQGRMEQVAREKLGMHEPPAYTIVTGRP